MRRGRWALRRGAHRVRSGVRQAAMRGRVRTFDADEPALVVAGSPRAGTTWLAEGLGRAARAVTVFEPLHPRRSPAGEAGFGWREFADAGSVTDEQLAYLRRVLSGGVINDWTASRESLRQIAAARRLLVKFVRANGVLAVLAAMPQCRAPLVVVRHPVATVASQLRHRSWTRPEAIDLAPFRRAFPAHARAAQGLERPEERLAALWAFDHLAANPPEGPRPWMVVHYEAVRRDPAAVAGEILAAWGLAPAGGVDWSRPSRTATGGGPRRDGRQLDPDAARRVMAVVRRFGIEAYDDGPDPVRPVSLVASGPGPGADGR